MTELKRLAGSQANYERSSVAKNWRHRQKQLGVALITVLMVFAIGTVLISKIVLQRSIDVQRVSAMVSRAQAHYYARAGEDLAILGLRGADGLDDATNNKDSDHLDEAWVQPISYDIDGFGQVAVQIIDLNRFYNINNMLESNGEINGKELQRFRHILTELDISEDLADNVADWLDADSNQEGYRSESESYINTPLGYRAADQRMHDIQELLQVEGFDADILAKLEPHVIALPIGDILPLNINTATRYALTSIEQQKTSDTGTLSSIGLVGSDDLIDARPYTNLDYQAAGLDRVEADSAYTIRVSSQPGSSTNSVDSNSTGNAGGGSTSGAGGSNSGATRVVTLSRRSSRASVSSDYFQINIRANYGGEVAYLTTVIRQEDRWDNAKYYVLSRHERDNSHRFLQQF